MAERVVLFSARTTDGDSSAVGWNGGRGALVVNGTWDGATMTLKAADASGNYISLGSDAELTADGIVNFDLPAGFTLRATLSNDGATTSLTAAVGGP